MITAVDTNILLDVFGADSTFGFSSKQMLSRCLQEGQLVSCEIVWSEIAGSFPSVRSMREAMHRLGIGFSPINLETALTAGKAWQAYRKQGGKRQRVIADFLIGAHAITQAERLLTRDRGFYRKYFGHLRVLDPSNI